MTFAMPPTLKLIDPETASKTAWSARVADCVILTHDNKILLQQRPKGSYRSAGCLTAFGGHIEPGETPEQAVIRELNEEVGAKIDPSKLVKLGAVSEEEFDHREIVHGYFWHDEHGTITGCYEGEAVYYDRIAGALAHPKIMDYVVWMLSICQERGLLPL